MSHWESSGKSNEWYTPPYVFDALGVEYTLDVAHPRCKTFSPCRNYYSCKSLSRHWYGFVWMNAPFEKRNGLVPWLDKFFEHGYGIALTPDRTSVDWWQDAENRCDALFHVKGKIKFIDQFGNEGKSPSNGTTLFACGSKGVEALITAQKNGLGRCHINNRQMWLKYND